MSTVTGKPNLIKLVNKNLILELLESKGPLSRADIAKRSKISPPTVSAIIEELLNEDLVTEIGEGDSSGGRKPTLVAFNPTSYEVIGVELKQDIIHCIAADLSGAVLYENRYSWGGDALSLDTLTVSIQQFLRDARSKTSGKWKGIGVAVPGMTDMSRGFVLQATELGWRDLALREILEKSIHLPVFVDNDVNMATLGEHWRGAGRDIDDLVFISIGKGIGAGLILNGELYRGASFSTGEIGYMIVSPHTLARHVEGYGPLELHYGKSAMEQMLAEKSLIEQQAYMEEAISHLAYALINVVCIINPKTIILDANTLLNTDQFNSLCSIIQRYTPSSVQIVKSSLRGYATTLGAVYSIIRSQHASVAFRHEI